MMRSNSNSSEYERLHREFYWLVPKRFNIAKVCVERWGKSDAPAIIEELDHAPARSCSYRQLHRRSNQVANVLRSLGIGNGDRVAVILPQCVETALLHLACYKLGAVAMPMSVLFGPDALEFRFQDSAAKLAVVDPEAKTNISLLQSSCPSLKHVLDTHELRRLLEKASDTFRCAETLADDPSVLIYTSGTTGAPKGALIPHRALIGNLPGFVASQNWFPKPGDVFWSPADWAWTGGLMDALLPTLYFGRPIIAYRGRFTAQRALEIMVKHRVTNSFLFPTALKMLMKEMGESPEPALQLRGLMSAGEAVGAALFEWSQHVLGVVPNEMFGQTELNYIVGNSSERWPAKPGSIGKAYPGHRVDVINEEGQVCKTGELGEIAAHRFDRHNSADPVFFLNYWNKPEATRSKFTENWCRTGDLAIRDEQGYLWYAGRADDMFKAAGYRIGPGEVENCLIQHPAVANAAVVPKPDPERGAVVKAYVVLVNAKQAVGKQAEQLIAQLQAHVRGKLAPYEYPKEIEFVESLPMTTTGKVQRSVLRLQEEQRAGLR